MRQLEIVDGRIDLGPRAHLGGLIAVDLLLDLSLDIRIEGPLVLNVLVLERVSGRFFLRPHVIEQAILIDIGLGDEILGVGDRRRHLLLGGGAAIGGRGRDRHGTIGLRESRRRSRNRQNAKHEAECEPHVVRYSPWISALRRQAE